MHRLSILYGQPRDPEAFDSHYFDRHIPLARAIPGLQRVTWSKPRSLDREPQVYLVAELWFASSTELRTALASPAMAAAGQDAQQFDVTFMRMFSGEVSEVATS